MKGYVAKEREPLHATYRGYEVISMPPPSSGGAVLIEMLNILEGYDLGSLGWSSSERYHLMTESMRRAFADRHIIALKGDWTRQNPDISAFLQQFGRSGVPLYLLYDRTGAPSVLPQILTQAGAPAEAAEPTLSRSLKPRHISMITIGGIIGAGLFVGSSVAIAAVGPAVIFSYLRSPLVCA